MLVKDETKYCWCEDEIAGEPQNSIKDAIEDYLEQNEYLFGECDSDHSYFGECDVESVSIGHPYYYVPSVDGERVIWNVCEHDLDDEIVDFSEEYMCNVKDEHMDELTEELTKVFQAWEKKHGYENTSWVVLETKEYRIGDYIKE
ncbi:hypothetical protein [Veillonella parvula]|uniref:hypothetical protein n=1 Tax=Veillonella parvula TaxID=29466 RepID=UPI00195F326E|nr:hypothetical protein [Veillonella parvula]VTY45663.1 Uncharacterised protein [Veillonella parvula]